jgi:hypothetical protein
MKTRGLDILRRAFFFLGVIIGFALTIITIWNRLEAMNYYFTGVKYTPFHGLKCPVIIAPTEKGVVAAVFNNPTDREDNFFYRVEISGRPFTRQVENQIAVPPHQTKSIQLTVDADDVDLLFFVLVKMTILPNAFHPAQEAVCGMMVANVMGLTGAQISTLALSLSFFGIAVGLGVWQPTTTRPDRNAKRAMQTLGFVVLLAVIAGVMGWWVLAIALSVTTILLVVISLRFAIA